jgi:S1-C subfamily serine protease
VSIQTIDEEGAKALGAEVNRGALVSDIQPGSAAEEAGLQVDDIIVKVDNKRIDDSRALANAIGLKGSGERVEIELLRDGETRTVTATLGELTATESAGADIHPGLSGAQFAAESPTSGGGIEVSDVESGSPAAQRGLRSGDIVIAVNRIAVRNLEQLLEIAERNEILFLLVRRADRQLMLQIR